LCDRAAVIPFLRSVSSGQEGEITPEVVEDVLADVRPSVTRDMLVRFEQWARAAATA
jgi:hypothetical protein